VYSMANQLTNISHAITFMLSGLAREGILPPYPGLEAIRNWEPPERDLATMQGWGLERNKELPGDESTSVDKGGGSKRSRKGGRPVSETIHGNGIHDTRGVTRIEDYRRESSTRQNGRTTEESEIQDHQYDYAIPELQHIPSSSQLQHRNLLTPVSEDLHSIHLPSVYPPGPPTYQQDQHYTQPQNHFQNRHDPRQYEMNDSRSFPPLNLVTPQMTHRAPPSQPMLSPVIQTDITPASLPSGSSPATAFGAQVIGNGNSTGARMGQDEVLMIGRQEIQPDMESIQRYDSNGQPAYGSMDLRQDIVSRGIITPDQAKYMIG
jgi:hypothetical protein